MAAFFVVSAIAIWFGVLKPPKERPAFLYKIIRPPKWLYYLVGAPKSKDFPPGVMYSVKFGQRIISISFLLFALALQMFRITKDGFVLIFGLAVGIPYLITYFASVKYLYSPRKNKKY